MRVPLVVSIGFVVACATESSSTRAIWIAAGGTSPCTQPPVGTAGFRHDKSDVATSIGEPRHRGVDLITSVTADTQLVTGRFAYGGFDKALEDEAVAIYTCSGAGWTALGTARTDSDGGFTLALTGDHRLAHGLHALYAITGDATGVAFSAYVADARDAIAVIDVDGTLTAGENDVVPSVLFGTDPTSQQDAATALSLLAGRYQWIYVTARGRNYTELTRDWLADHGFPPGPVILAPGLTLPGSAAAEYKASALAALRAAHVPITIAIGNRATDARAYTGANVPRIFVKEPEYRDELAPYVAAKLVVPFEHYADLPQLVGR